MAILIPPDRSPRSPRRTRRSPARNAAPRDPAAPQTASSSSPARRSSQQTQGERIPTARLRDPAPDRSPRRAQPSPPKAQPQRSSAAPSRAHRPALSTLPGFRLVVVWAILIVAMLLLLLNLLRIQVFESSKLHELAKGQQMISLNPVAPRRPIIDRSGNVLAIDKPVYTLFAHPILFQQPKDAIAAAVAPLINQKPTDLLTKLNSGDSGIQLAEGLSEDVTQRLTRLRLDGLEPIQQQQRLYPQQNLFSESVGYVNLDRQGQMGVEYSMQSELELSSKSLQLSRSGDGLILPINLPDNFVRQDAQQLQLTLDSRLQRAARQALKAQMDKFSAKRGAVVVMNVQDGSLLSLASEPSYDPNKYYTYELERLKDWVLTDLYEPGSTFKPINVAIALEAGAIKPDDHIYDEGAIQIGEWPIQNSDYSSAGGRGDISITDVMKYSSNVGMVHIMQALQPGVFYGWLTRLGLDKPTGIDLPFEAAGQMKSYPQFTGASIEPATTAFGQGFSLTPIKLAQLHSIIGNGGKLVTPHVVRGLVNPDGQLAWQPDRTQPRPVFSAHNAKAVLEMMEQVVVDGTGKPAQIPGYRIAGKTGTAQKAGKNGGYIEGARITSFVGMFPVEAPRYVVLCVVDEPQGDDAYGSTVAAPVVKEVMEAIITIDQIPPSSPEQAIPEEQPQ